ncbi:MAG TPA: 50S ribosomal protein L13 [Methanospirillum sp.]|jgi:large subunit ribosomal protein L13|uniref:50S ribosomal protein L13 n=1 Tax=Methanospirillum sp. TaxID=45200 RepID=UPI001BD591C0|nr:50S ribosomal protein L13 [Methanospirillum sp.]HPY60044.1 50S ribosomal protein L13 [Methanospirillum sp.]
MVTIIDGDGLLVGRLASNVAKRALAGEEIAVINAEKAIISGNRARVLNNYKQKRQRGSREGGPFFPRRPDHILKRTIRGMVPYKRERGIEAMKRIRIYVGVPDEFSGQPVETIENASRKRLGNPSHVTLGAVSTFLGAKY